MPIPALTISEVHTHTDRAVRKTDVSPSVAGDELVVHRVTSTVRRTRRGEPWQQTTVTSEVCQAAEDLVLVVVRGWSCRVRLDGVHAFSPGATGWRKVNVTARVLARVQGATTSPTFAPAARAVLRAVAEKEARETAAEERKSGSNVYVDPDDPTRLLRFTSAEVRAVRGMTFPSVAAMIRMMRNMQDAAATAGGLTGTQPADA